MLNAAVARNEVANQLVRMSAIVNSSPQCIMYAQTRKTFQYVNQSTADLTGYSIEELKEGGLGLLVSKDVFERVASEILPRAEKEGSYSFELPIHCKDGQQRIMAGSVFGIGLSDDGFALIASDMTERRRLEQDLLAAKEQAEQSSLAKSDFLSRMSHEMRTPMNAIIGMTHIAKGTQDAAKKEYCLDKIDNASTHLLGVINDILDMSKIEAGKFEISEAEFNFEKMLIRVINVMNFRIEEKKQNFTIHMDKDLPASVVSDEQRLAQVVTNLLSNAVKFTPAEGSIVLSVQKLNAQGNQCTLRFSAQDTGIGISKEQQSKLFTSFEQADGGIARRFGGTGLGLAISKNIVTLLGGKIWIESELGQGASFIFEIPVTMGNAPQYQLLRPEINWGMLRVLAVDDSSDVREYFTSFASAAGFGCETAASGKEAMEILEANRESPFNIIFVDWAMPGMDGIELTREIKQRYGSNTVVIMISATEWETIAQAAKTSGVDAFLPKPLFSSQIIDCINNCLGIKQQSAQTSKGNSFKGRFAGRHVLLAEDMEINREIVLALLEETGLTFSCAENGVQAVEMFRQNPAAYDIIFMDIHMPEMDGYEATEQIRALPTPKAKTIPIIAMTANVFREDIEKCLAAGMNSHVGKPIDFDEVMERLAKYSP